MVSWKYRVPLSQCEIKIKITVTNRYECKTSIIYSIDKRLQSGFKTLENAF